MKTNPSNYFDLLALGLGNTPGAFQNFINKFEEKYNAEQIDGFAWDNEIQIGYDYHQLLVENKIATLPVYMDPDAEALDKQIHGFEVGTGSIPTQKHGYGFNTRILRERMLMIQQFGSAAVNAETKEAILNLMFESTDMLYKGNVNARTHQRMQIVSTGKFTISAANNPRGITGIELNFGTTELTANATTARWWTNADHTTEGSASDPVKEMKQQIREFYRAGYPAMQVEMSVDLFDDLMNHSKVLTAIGYNQNPAATSDGAVAYARNLDDNRKKAILESIIKAPIVVRDSVARADEFDSTNHCLKTKNVENFNKLNIAYVPQGELGTIKSVRQLVLADDPTARYALADGGRTLISQVYNAKTKSCFTASEGAWLCVPQMAKYMAHKTVTA